MKIALLLPFFLHDCLGQHVLFFQDIFGKPMGMCTEASIHGATAFFLQALLSL